jgi:hypothetical protein
MQYLDRTLLNYHAHLALTVNEKQYRKEMKKLGIKDPDDFVINGCQATVHFLENSEGDRCSIVCIKPGLKLKEALGILVHESIHLWQDYLKYIGENKASEEFEAYAVQGIFSKLLDSYLEQTKRKLK